MTAKKLRRAYARKILRASRHFGWGLQYGDAQWWAHRCVTTLLRWEGKNLVRGCGPAPTLAFDTLTGKRGERGARVWAALERARSIEWGSGWLNRYYYVEWAEEVQLFFEAMD